MARVSCNAIKHGEEEGEIFIRLLPCFDVLRPLIEQIIKYSELADKYVITARDFSEELLLSAQQLDSFISQYGKYILAIPIVGRIIFTNLTKLQLAIKAVAKFLDETVDLLTAVHDFIQYVLRYLKVS